MTYAIIGTGAVGGYYGGQLLRQGYDVHFLARSDYHTLHHHGLTIVSETAPLSAQALPVYADTAQMPQSDVIIVALKTTQNNCLATLLTPILKPNSLIILLQNGVGMEADLQAQLPQVQIVAGVAHIFATKIAPARIAHYALGNLTLAPYTDVDILQLSRLVQAFQNADLSTRTGNYHETRWKKAIWNIAFNGLSAWLKMPPSELVRNTTHRLRAQAIMEELRCLANCYCEKPINQSFVERNLEATQTMAPYLPSMYYDCLAHRPMELHYLYEKPLLWAEKQGIALPQTQQLYTILRE